MDVGILYTVIIKQIDKLLGREFAHEIRRNPVVRLCQSPFQSHHLTISATVGVARCPWATSHIICLLNIWGNIAGRETILHGKRIKEGLDSGAHLTTPVHTHVVVEVNEVHATHIGLDMAVLRTHAHESAAQERLIILDGVERCHSGIYLTVIGEDAHRHGGTERAGYFLIRCALLFEHTIALALINRSR